MSVTRWECQHGMSSRLRGIWDARRDGRDWHEVFEEARGILLRRLELDAELVRSMSWDEFKRLQGIGPLQKDEASA